jgi:hypothetical protein
MQAILAIITTGTFLHKYLIQGDDAPRRFSHLSSAAATRASWMTQARTLGEDPACT